jgi:hypothetical protein
MLRNTDLMQLWPTKLSLSTDTVPKGEEGMRPLQYAFLDRLMREAGIEYVDSLKKARQYKTQALRGDLSIQTIRDARANPPRGFFLPTIVDIPGKSHGG